MGAMSANPVAGAVIGRVDGEQKIYHGAFDQDSDPGIKLF